MWKDPGLADEDQPDPERDALIKERATQALERIHKAFASILHPGEKAILLEVQENVDGKEMVDAFLGRPWHSLSAEELFFHREVLPTLGPKGLAYYLPAYLVQSLQPGYKPDLRDYTLRALRKQAGETDVSFARRFSLLSFDQKEAVKAFLLAVLVDRGGFQEDPALRTWGLGPAGTR